MKVIIAGGRNFNNYNLLKIKCNYLLQNYKNVEIVCGGCATGADELGRQYAIANEISIKFFEPDWDKYGRAAGPIRNKQMAEYADALIAFWDGKSKGTANMIKQAKQHDLKIQIYYYEKI